MAAPTPADRAPGSRTRRASARMHGVHRSLPLLTTALLVLPACAVPDLTASAPSGPPTATGPNLDAPDPRLAALGSEVEALRTTVVAARDALVTVRDAHTLAAARAAAELAVHTLTAAPHLSGDLDGDGTAADPRVAPLLPGPADAIGPDATYGDVFSQVLTAARAAGAAGSDVIELLRDPLGGSIAGWQEDAAGRLRAIEAVARSRDVATAEQRVADELEGEVPRALAWALLAVRARDIEQAGAAAARGIVHLDLTLEGIAALGQERG